MQGKVEDSAWDFTPVFDLIHSLRTNHDSLLTSADRDSKRTIDDREILEHRLSEPSSAQTTPLGLGNFNQVWDYLGLQRDTPSPALPHFEVSTAGKPDGKEAAYTSDGALYYPASSKSVRWRDDDDGRDLTDVQPDNPRELQLTKTQRKKRNRKLRKAADTVKRAEGKDQPDTLRDSSGSAQDSDDGPTLPIGDEHAEEPHPKGSEITRVGPRAASHIPRSTKRPSDARQDAENTIPKTPQKTLPKQHEVPSTTKATTRAIPTIPSTDIQSIDFARKQVAAALQLGLGHTYGSEAKSSNTIHQSLKKRWPVINSQTEHYSQLPVTPTPASKTQREPRTVPAIGYSNPVPVAPPSVSKGRHEILPLHNQSSIDRNWALFLKVLHNFPQDRRYLVSPLQLSINRPQSNGIHVFVDASNIIIGFMEHLKRSRCIPSYAKVPRVDLNFHALALLLERRRPVARRVLAGSTPEVPAFEEARQVGYETNILDKVYKARELTERQKYFEARDRGYTSASDGNGTGGNASDGATQRQPKWVEQAVDEILHLKILESVIDNDVPAEGANGHGGESSTLFGRPTMVVATGDAAEAEYSPGFLKMVERALKKGWNVEVMAFGRSVSAGYRKMEKQPMERGGWGERFKIIELDEYAEELFGESM